MPGATQLDGPLSGICPNCGSPRRDRFCARCGQNDRSYIRSLPLMMWEFLREAFEMDSRLLRTFKLMATRPGELPAEFSRDRRADYSSPVRLYLFASIAFFFVLSLTAELGAPPAERLAAARERPAPPGAQAGADAVRALLPPEQARKWDDIMDDETGRLARAMILQIELEPFAEEVETEPFSRFLLTQFVDVLHQPRVAFDRLIDNLPIAMFFMLPAYALLLACFYPRRGRFYVEHFVFAMHIHIVAFVAFTVMLLVPENVVGDYLTTAIALWLAGYYYLALRRYYGGGRAVSGVKWLGLMALYSLMLGPGFLLVMFVTLYSL